MRPRLEPLLAVAWLTLVPAGDGLAQESRFLVPPVSLPEFSLGRSVFVHAESTTPVIGFQVRLHHDPTVLRLDSITSEGTDVEGAFFFQGQHDPDRGTVEIVAVLEAGTGRGLVLPADVEHRIAHLRFDVIAPRGSSSLVGFQPDGPAETPRVELGNRISTRVEGEVAQDHPVTALTGGTVTVIPRALEPEAGPDSRIAERTTIVLDGSDTTLPAGRDVRFRWSQITPGPLARIENPGGAITAVQIPDVDDDITLTFQLEVDDGLGPLVDLVHVEVIDLDSRVLELERPSVTATRLPDSVGVVALEFELTWNSIHERGRLDGLGFDFAGGETPRTRLTRPRLVLDLDRDGIPGGVEPVYSPRAPVGSPLSRVDFDLDLVLASRDPLPFLLIVDVLDPPPVEGSTGAAAGALLALIALGFLAARRERERFRTPRRAPLLLSFLGLWVLFAGASCGGGGGGGGGAPPAPAATPVTRPLGPDEVRTTLARIDLRGELTSLTITVADLPLAGPAFKP